MAYSLNSVLKDSLQKAVCLYEHLMGIMMGHTSSIQAVPVSVWRPHGAELSTQDGSEQQGTHGGKQRYIQCHAQRQVDWEGHCTEDT